MATPDTAAASTTTMGLSFPPQTFQRLAPQSFLHRHLQGTQPTRPSSRAPDEFRQPTIHTNALSHAQGSAVVRNGDTAVVCGVRGEILGLMHGEGRQRGKIVVQRSGVRDEDDPDAEIRTHSLLVPNLELGTGCSRDYHPGPPSDFAQAVAERLRSLLIDTTALVPASTLQIQDADGETKAYWVLYIDIVCISLDGNILDTAWAAVVAALRMTRLPAAMWDADREVVVCDPDLARYRPVEMRSLAFTASFCVHTAEHGDDDDDAAAASWVLSDPDEFEESVCVERILVCIGEGGKIKRIEKSGGLSDVAETLPTCIKRARERYDTWIRIMP